MMYNISIQIFHGNVQWCWYLEVYEYFFSFPPVLHNCCDFPEKQNHLQ